MNQNAQKKVDSCEDEISSFNGEFFFSEFAFSPGDIKFKKTGVGEIELSDGMIILDNEMLLFQIKERDPKDLKALSEDSENKWFKSKVLKDAKNQIKDTINNLINQQITKVKNQRGHELCLRLYENYKASKLIIYKTEFYDLLPKSCKDIKYYISNHVGIIHIIREKNYHLILNALITPGEIIDYFYFRENLIEQHKDKLNDFLESNLLGQYLSGKHDDLPCEKFKEYFLKIDHNKNEWSISSLIKFFYERLMHTALRTNNNDYYFILTELAKLYRFELKEFKLRLDLSINKIKNNVADLPYRFACPRTSCGFIFIPLLEKDKKDLNILLEMYTSLHKYEHQLEKCVGLVVFSEGNGYYQFQWSYMNDPWEHYEAFEDMLNKGNIFRKTEFGMKPRFDFLD